MMRVPGAGRTALGAMPPLLKSLVICFVGVLMVIGFLIVLRILWH